VDPLPQLHAFLIKDCVFSAADLVVCRIRPADSSRDWGYVRPRGSARGPRRRRAVWLRPSQDGPFTAGAAADASKDARFISRQDGCYCDFSTDIAAVEGMSGSPVISGKAK